MATPLIGASSALPAQSTLKQLKATKIKSEQKVNEAFEAFKNSTLELAGTNAYWESNGDIKKNGQVVRISDQALQSEPYKAFTQAFSIWHSAATKFEHAQAAASATPTHLPPGMPGSAASSLFSSHSAPGGSSAASFPLAPNGAPTIPGSHGGSGMPGHSSGLLSGGSPFAQAPGHSLLGSGHSASASSAVSPFEYPPAPHGAPIPSSLAPTPGYHSLGPGPSTSASIGVPGFGHPPAAHPAAPHGAPVAPAASVYNPHQVAHLENEMLRREIENLQQQQQKLKRHKEELAQIIEDQSTHTAALARGITRVFTLGLSNGEEISREQLEQKISEVEAQITALQAKIAYYTQVQTTTHIATKSLRVKILIERQMINQLRDEIPKIWEAKSTATSIELPDYIKETEINSEIKIDQNTFMSTHLTRLQNQAKNLKEILEAAKLLKVRNT